MKILFIDDDEASHTYHGLMADEAGIPKTSIQHFMLVDKALEFLNDIIQNDTSEEWPTHIFIDINMPMKSGFDFVKEYSELNHCYPDPSVVFVSSVRSQNDLSKIKAYPIIKDIKEKFLEADYFIALKAAES